jgi:uncharacterized repeat protein (TIGR01451 family)
MSTRRFATSTHALAAGAVLWIAICGGLFARPVLGQTIVSKQVEECQPGQFCIVKGAELAVPLCPGGNIAYFVELENLTTLTGSAQILDPIPAGTTFVQGSASNGATYDAANDRIVWEGPLPPGQSWTIGFSVTVDPGVPNPSTITNVATGTLIAGETPLQVQVPIDVQVNCPPLALGAEKTAELAQPLACPGGNVFWQVRFTNSSNRPRVLTAAVDDPVPAGMTFAGSLTEGCAYDAGAHRVTCEDIPIGPGQTKSIGFSTTVDAGASPEDTFTNTATVTLSDPQVGDSVQEQAEETVTCPEPPLELGVEKTAEFAEPLECPGGNVFWQVRFTNSSDRPRVLTAAVDDLVPAGMTFAGSLTEGCAYNAGTRRVTCNGIPIGPGETKSIGFSTTVAAGANPGDAFTNTATVTLSDPVEEDSVQEEAQATVTCPEGGGDDDDDGGEQCPIEVIGFVSDKTGNGQGRPYPVSNSRVWLFDVEDDPLPIAPLSEQKYKPLREQRTNRTSETGLKEQEFPNPGSSGYEFDFTTQEVSQCPPRAVVVSALWDADDRFAVAPRNLIGGRHVPIYLARCISDRPAEVLPVGHCLEWRLHEGTYVPWNPFLNQRVNVDFEYGLDLLTEDSTEVIHDPTTKAPRLSESWDLGGRDAKDYFQDAAHLYFFSYKAMEYLQELADDVREASAEIGKAGGAAPTELKLSPALVQIAPAGTDCNACARPVARSFGKVTPEASAVSANTLVTFDVNSAKTSDPNKPDNREWHELGHYWMIQLYDGGWPDAFKNNQPGCGSPRKMVMPGKEHEGPLAGSGNHCGYANDSTADSFVEGFAEFTSMLIADYYGDPQPNMYQLGSSPKDLEVDLPVWGHHAPKNLTPGQKEYNKLTFPAAWEEFAVAGILWDVFDDSAAEPHAKGEASTLTATEDLAHHPAPEIFARLRGDRPDTRPGTLSALFDRLSPNILDDTNGNGFPDVEEIFIAHRAFDDKTRNLVQDVGEHVGSTGSGSLPKRLKRDAPEPIPNGFLGVRVAADGASVPPDSVDLELRYIFDPPFEYYNSEVTVRGTDRLDLHLAPSIYPSRVEITAVGEGENGELRSDPLTITSDQYWSAIEAGAPSVGEHTFVLEPEKPPDPPDGPWLTSPELPGFEAKVRITPPGGDGIAGAAEPACIIESLCVSGALPGRPEVFVKVIGPRPNGKLWAQISRFTPSAVEVWLRQIATDTIRYYRLDSVAPASDDVSGLQDRGAFDPPGAEATVPRGALLAGGAVEPLPRLRLRLGTDPRPLEPGEPEPPAGLDWLTTPELPGFRMKAAITPVGGPVVGGQRVDLCIPETLCIHGALAGRPEVFAKIIGPRPNGFLWVQAARFTPSQVELWVEQSATGTVRYYRLDAVGPAADDVSGLQDRGAFLP